MEDQIHPLTWAARTGTMPILPGPRSHWLDILRGLMQGPYEVTGAKPQEPEADQPKAAELSYYTLRGLARAGLLEQAESQFTATSEARRWYDSGDLAILVGILHTRIRFVGELMDALAEEPRSSEELLNLARAQYGFRWESPGPVHNRTSWLAVTGMVDLFDGRLHLTEAGHRLQPRLVPGAPDTYDQDTPVDLPTPPSAIAALIEALHPHALHNRAHGLNLYIPGTQKNAGRLEALRLLTEAAIPSITDEAFTQLIFDRFPNARTLSTARTARDTAKALGLIHRTSSQAWSATSAGEAWVTTDQPLDLARTVHANLAYFGEILHDLDAQVTPTAAGLAEHSRAYFPNRARNLSRVAVTARLGLLLACGLVSKLSQTAYQVTPLGRAFRNTLPCLPLPDTHTTTPSDTPTGYEETASAIPHPSQAERLAAELQAAARDSTSPQRLEEAAIAALAYLGMPGEHIGGSGNPDGYVRFGIGTRSTILAVETKSSATGRVAEQPLFGLQEHRKKIGAETTLLIGPGFERRLLQAADDDLSIAVIPTDLLADTVRSQALTPLTPTQLHPLVNPALRADQRQEPLRQAWQTQLRHTEIERALVDILTREAEDPLQEGGWLDITAIRRDLRNSGYRAEHDEVTEALNFLSSPRIAVVEQSSHGYRATVTADVVTQRIQALGQQWAIATPTC